MIAVDLPGFGESELPHEEISIPGYGRFVDAFLGEIGVERASLVGNSMGGFIAAETAISHPSRVEKLVLVYAAGGPTLHDWHHAGGSHGARLARLFQLIAGTRSLARGALVRRPRAAPHAAVQVARSPRPHRSPSSVYEVASGAGKPGFSTRFSAIVRLRLPRPPAGDRSCPTLIVWGAGRPDRPGRRTPTSTSG